MYCNESLSPDKMVLGKKVTFCMNFKENRKRWKKIINEQSKSNKTIVQFCKDNDLNLYQFHYYKKKMNKEREENETSNFVEVIQPVLIRDGYISMSLNGIDVKIDHHNLIKLLYTVKQLD